MSAIDDSSELKCFVDDFLRLGAGEDLAGIVFEYMGESPEFYLLFLNAMRQRGQEELGNSLVTRSIEQIRTKIRGNSVMLHAMKMGDWAFFRIILKSKCPLYISEILRQCALAGKLDEVRAIIKTRVNDLMFEQTSEGERARLLYGGKYQQIHRAVESLCHEGYGIESQDVLDSLVNLMLVANDREYRRRPEDLQSQYNGVTMALTWAANTGQRNFIEYVRKSPIAQERTPVTLLRRIFPPPAPQQPEPAASCCVIS